MSGHRLPVLGDRGPALAPTPISRARLAAPPYPLVSVFGGRAEHGARVFAEHVRQAAAARGVAVEICDAELPPHASAVVSVGWVLPARVRALLTIAITEGLAPSAFLPEARALRDVVDVHLAEPRRAVAEAIADRLVRASWAHRARTATASGQGVPRPQTPDA